MIYFLHQEIKMDVNLRPWKICVKIVQFLRKFTQILRKIYTCNKLCKNYTRKNYDRNNYAKITHVKLRP